MSFMAAKIHVTDNIKCKHLHEDTTVFKIN